MFMQAVFTAITIILPMECHSSAVVVAMLVPLVRPAQLEALGDLPVQLAQPAQKAHKVLLVTLAVLRVLPVQLAHRDHKETQEELQELPVHLVTRVVQQVLLAPKVIREQQEPLDLQAQQVQLDHVVPLA